MDVDHFKAAMSRWGSGVAIITTIDGEGQPYGFTATSLTSLSLSPPMVLFCLARDAGVAEAFTHTEAFAAHILSDKQQELSNTFAKSNVDRFSGVPHSAGYEGVPLLENVLVVLECRITARYPGGDHTIIVGEVQGGDVQEEGQPLIYFKGRYASL